MHKTVTVNNYEMHERGQFAYKQIIYKSKQHLHLNIHT